MAAMADETMRPWGPALPRRSMPTAVGWPLGAGVLWLLYGWFELSMPLGVDAVYDSRRGFEVVVDRGVFALYSVAGACALLAASMTLMVVSRGATEPRARWTRRLSRSVMALAGIALVGAAVSVVPLFFAPQVLATPVLGAAAWLAAAPEATPSLRLRLRCLGTAACALLALWPAVWALGVLSPQAGIVLIGCFGAGWATLAPDVAAVARRSDIAGP